MQKVIIKRCNEEPKIEEVKEINLEYMQSVVDGLIEIPYLSEYLYKLGVDIVINEEGKINGLDPNMLVFNNKMEIADVLMGDILFASSNDDGKSIGLSNEQIEGVMKIFKENVAITNLGSFNYILMGDE